jgi:hypothetical protein
VTSVGQGIFSTTGSFSSYTVQKYDGLTPVAGHNQYGTISLPNDNLPYFCYGWSGLEGKTEGTRNKLYINGSSAPLDIAADFSLTATSKIGSLGRNNQSAENVILRDGKLLGWGSGLTLAETALMNQALLTLASKSNQVIFIYPQKTSCQHRRFFHAYTSKKRP